MTDLELKTAREKYKILSDGKKEALYFLKYSRAKEFASKFLGINAERVNEVSEKEILRTTFLSTFQNFGTSSNLMVYINCILRENNKIDDMQPELISFDWEKEELKDLVFLPIHSLYCDLETNKPILIDSTQYQDFSKENHIIA